MPKAADDAALGSGLLANSVLPREDDDGEPEPVLPRCLQFSRLSRGQAVLAAAGVAVLALAPIVAIIELKGPDRSCAEDIDCGGNRRGHCDDGACVCESARYGGERCGIACGEHGTFLAGRTCACEPGLGPAAWNSTTREPLCSRSVFRGSRLLTTDWGAALSGMAGMAGQEWALCCSTFEGCDNGTKFHAACDGHTPTLTVVHNGGGTYLGKTNPGNFTFGGFVRTPPL